MDFSGEVSPIDGSDAEMDGAFGELTPLVQDLVPHSKSHSLESLGGFDLGSDATFDVYSGNLIENLAGGYQVISPAVEMVMDGATMDFFADFGPFNCPSIYSKESLDLDSISGFCAPEGGYIVHSPNATDRMWRAPKRGWQSITDISFTYGFRLPMHPFFMTVLKTFDCAIGQLAPNTILQISGLITACNLFSCL